MQLVTGSRIFRLPFFVWDVDRAPGVPKSRRP